jgi:hypothetical protein
MGEAAPPGTAEIANPTEVGWGGPAPAGVENLPGER